jgi:predicted aspartyl protease
VSYLRPALILLLAVAAPVHAEDSAAVLARAKAASGGQLWEGARSWRGDGTFAAGGLSGEFHQLIDLQTGRSADSYKFGSASGADGYDGTHAWGQDPGGEIAALDAPEAVRRARTQAWLDAHAYWFPQRFSASIDKLDSRQDHGKKYAVMTVTPKDGDPVVLWFAGDSGLLARVEQRQAQDVATTSFDDYREVAGLRLPFHVVTDLTDAARRTDPRRRTEVRFARIATNVPVAAADFAMPAMAATARVDDPSGVASIPFQLVNNHIYVDGRINGEPARLVVDTGGFNMLTPVGAHKFGITGEGKLSAAGTGEDRTDLEIGHAKSVSVGAVTLDAPVFYIADLGRLSAVEGVEFDGLVGYEVFRRFGVQIDYANGRMTIAEPAHFVAPAGATQLPFQLDDHQPIITATLDGRPIRISIDTGSRSSLTLHSPFVRQNALLARAGAKVESVTGWGVGGAQRGYPARLGSLQLGDLRVDGIAADLFAGDKGSFANPDIGGNMGGGVLRRFTVAFDYANRRVYLKPNAHFGEFDNFDRSGLWLLGDGDALKVADVAAGSAGAQAGLRTGDRITAIGGEAVPKRTLPQWRQLLAESPAGTVLLLQFARDGAPKNARIVLADRIPAQLE